MLKRHSVCVFSSWDAPILYLLIDMMLIFLFVKGRWALWSLMNKAIKCLRMLDVFRNSTDFIFRGFLMTSRGCWVSWYIGTNHLLLEILCCLWRRLGRSDLLLEQFLRGEHVSYSCYSNNISVDNSPVILLIS